MNLKILAKKIKEDSSKIFINKFVEFIYKNSLLTKFATSSYWTNITS
jgi:hypothetical protein